MELNYKIYYNNKLINLPESRNIYLDKKGTIKVVCKVSDYLGTNVASAEAFLINVLPKSDPVIFTHNVPHSATKGKLLEIPDFEAIDFNYSKSNHKYYAEKRITINGIDISDSKTYQVTQSKNEILTVKYIFRGLPI